MTLSAALVIVRGLLAEVNGWVGFALDAEPFRVRLRVYVDFDPSALWWIGTVNGWMDLIPGLEVQTVRTGRFRPPIFRPTAGLGPVGGGSVQSGAPIASSRSHMHGSIGFFARNGDDRWAVSANHVLSGNGQIKPRPGLDFISTGTTQLGDTVRAKTISGTEPNQMDAAACKLTPPLAATAYPHVVAFHAEPFQPPFGAEVFLVGRTDRKGNVVEPNAQEFHMSMANVEINIDEAIFVNQILVKGQSEIFIEPGDSGGLIAATVGGVTRPVGIVIGTADGDDSSYALATPVQTILSSSELNLGTIVS